LLGDWPHWESKFDACRFEALSAWRKQKIGVLQKLAADVEQGSAAFEQTRRKNVMAALGPAPTGNEEIEHLRQIRDWLRGKPEAER
jgi:hypothetical protein